MITAPSIKANDTIGIVAPGRKIKREEIDAAITVIESWGVKTMLAENLFSSKHNYLAGSDQERLEDFQKMIDNKVTKTILCARGGYGSTRILDQLNFESLINNPKWIVGFSDITAIHLKLFSLGLQSIHGTMPILFSKENSKSSVEHLRKILFGDKSMITAEAKLFNRKGTCTAQTVGGNLSLILDSLGTHTELETNDKILIIEEIDEYSYRVDRMMTQLKRAGKLKNLAGLIIGHFTDIKDTELHFGESVEEIIMNVVRDYNYPVAFGFPVGHENPNLAWVHGGSATLTIDEKISTLTYS